MSSVKILHTADLHIGAPIPDGGAATRAAEVADTFGFICSLCRDEAVDICLIAGDLFHSNTAGKAFFPSLIRHITDTPHTHFFYAAGNHDPLDSSSPFVGADLPENLTVFPTEFSEVTLEDKRVRVKGISFSRPFAERVDTAPMADDGYINILLLHGDLNVSDSRYNPISTDYIEKIAPRYAALGHIHSRTPIKQVGSTLYAYSGCPEGQGFDETGVKGVYIGVLSEADHDLHFLPTCRRMYIKESFKVSEAADPLSLADALLSYLSEKYGRGFGDNFYKITLTGALPDPTAVDLAQITQRLADSLYRVKVINLIRPAADLNLLAEEKSLRGLFVKVMRDKMSTADEGDLPHLGQALLLGLAAFNAEVKYDEDSIC